MTAESRFSIEFILKCKENPPCMPGDHPLVTEEFQFKDGRY